MAVTSAQVQELYIGYLGRPADQAGLNYWVAQLNAAAPTLTLENLRANFVNEQEEFQTFYNVADGETIDRGAFVTAIYENLFDRTPDADEVGYWQYGSAVNTDQLAVAILAAASTDDRAIVDAKTAFADQLTTTLGINAAATDLRSIYDTAVAAAVAEQGGANPPAAIDSYNAAFAEAISSLGFDETTGAYNAYSATTGSIVLDDDFTGTAITVSGSELTDLSIAGTVTGATLTVDAASVTNSDITSLTLGLQKDGALGLALTGFDDLVVLNASSSTADLTLDATTLTSLTNLTTGAGDDFVTVATGTDANAAALNVATGAGIDTVNATINNANVLIATGEGNDTVNLNIASGISTSNHGAEIALGAGDDTLSVTGSNIQFYSGSAAAQASQLNAGLIVVDDFSTTDHLVIDGATYLNVGALPSNSAGVAALNAATTLAGKLSAAASLLGSDENNASATAVHFEFNGNTYAFEDAGTVGTFGAGDTVVQLSGVTGLTDANFAAAV